LNLQLTLLLYSPYYKRVFYNVHIAIDIANCRLLVMQNVSLVDGQEIPNSLKLQVEDVGGNQQLYEKILGQFNEFSNSNGMFLTSYQKFLENFDYGYINWNTAMPLPNQPQLLFNNCYAIHRKDQFAISNNFSFVSLCIPSYFSSTNNPNQAGNPQFKLKILEQYQDTVIWIFLQKHSATNDYQVFFY